MWTFHSGGIKMRTFINFPFRVACIDRARLSLGCRGGNQYRHQPTHHYSGQKNPSCCSRLSSRPFAKLYLRIAASYIHHVVAQRVEKLKRSAVVSLVQLHQRLAHGNAELPGRLVLEVVSRLSAESWQWEEAELWWRWTAGGKLRQVNRWKKNNFVQDFPKQFKPLSVGLVWNQRQRKTKKH